MSNPENHWTLKKHQIDFLDAREKYPALFGGVGNGKTLAGCLAIIEDATQFDNNLCLVGRQTYPELRDSTREEFLMVLRRLYSSGAFQFNKAENSITFWNGSVVIFRHLDNPASLLGPNLGSFYIDQAEEVSQDSFETLQSRLRRPGIPRRRGLITGNPRGHNWVFYKYGLDKMPPDTIVRDWKHGSNYRMLSIPTIDNIENLPPDYVDNLKESYSPEMFQRLVMGAWDAFEGQIFDLTKITGYSTLPKIKMTLCAVDPAISKDKEACNTAFCTLGVGEDGHIYDLETIAGKWSFLETLEEAKKLVSRRKQISYLGIEDVAYQRALFEACHRYFPDINVIDIKADRDKFRRAKSVSHIIDKGLFHSNDENLLSELSAFQPDAKGKEKKDRVDALVHGLHMVQVYGPWLERDVSPNKEFEGLDSHTAHFKNRRNYNALVRSGSSVEVINPSDRDLDPDYY